MRLLRYVKGTLDYRQKYHSNKNGNTSLYGYADSDWARDIALSSSCYIFQADTSAVLWSSERQSAFALYATDAEYITLFLARQEAFWLPFLLKDIGFTHQRPTITLEERVSSLVKNLK